MGCIALYLFGTPRIERDGAPVTIERRKALALLIYLAVTRQPQTRDALAALLWPDADQARARANLRNALWSLEHALEQPLFDAARETIGLRPQLELWTDVSAFQQHLAACATHGHAPDDVCPRCLDELAPAMTLCQGEFMTGFTLRDSVAFDDWQFQQAESLRRDMLAALERLVRGHSAENNLTEALEYARRRAALDPLDEHVHRQVMQLYAQSGERAAALRQYQICTRVLQAELGVDPSPETVALYEAIKANQLAPLETGRGNQEQRQPGAAATAGQGEAVVQSASPSPHLHVSTFSLSPLVGRARELAEIMQLLEHPDNRLVTLCGLGGIGKTRLAQAVAEACAARGLSVYFVALEAVPSTDLLVPTIAEALNFTFAGQQSQQAQLINYLRDKRMLIVLDNFEHLLDGAALLPELLANTAYLRLLVTSRERLVVRGEWTLEIGGLSVPPEAEESNLDDYDAPHLFLQIARQSHPHFTPVAEDRAAITRICRIVAGMPLGIELAAAWVRVFSCAEIADEISQTLDTLEATQRNVPARHRTLRAVFDRSWALLPERERDVFMRLSVFRGGFTREAAQQVANATMPLLVSLADKSLIQRIQTGHFDVLDTVRQFAAEKLAADPAVEATTRTRHCQYYAALLNTQATRLHSVEEQAALQIIGDEIENARAAWQWAVEHDLFDALDQALESLATFYELRGWLQEGLTTFARTVARLEAVQADAHRLTARLLLRQGMLAFHSGQREHARALFERAMALVTVLADQYERALCLRSQGFLLRATDAAAAQRAFEESSAICAEIHDDWGHARALNGLGASFLDQGDVERAVAVLEQALRLFQKIGDERGMAYVLTNLGNVDMFQGRYQQALDRYALCFDIFARLGDRRHISLVSNNRGIAASALKNYAQAKQYHMESLRTKREMGERQTISLALNNVGFLCYLLGELNEADHVLGEALALAQDNDDTSMIVRISGSLGLVKVAQGELNGAAALFRSGFQRVGETQSVPLYLSLLVETAMLFLAREQYQPARDLFAFVLNHPKCEAVLKDRYQAYLVELDVRLGAETVAASTTRVAQWQLDDAAGVALALLSADGP